MEFDFLITSVNILFMFIIIPQLFKNYKVKNTVSHSLIYHILTCVGFAVLMYAYFGIGMLFSVCTITFNLIVRIIFSMQIIYYNREKTTWW